MSIVLSQLTRFRDRRLKGRHHLLTLVALSPIMSETALRTAAWVCSSRPGCENHFWSWRHSCAASLPSKETCRAGVCIISYKSSYSASCSRSARSALTWLLAMSWLSKLLKLCTALALPAVSAADANCITSAVICPRWPAMPAHAVPASV